MAPSARSIAANEVDLENDKSSKLEARIAHLESLLQQLGQGVLGAKSLAPIDTVEKDVAASSDGVDSQETDDTEVTGGLNGTSVRPASEVSIADSVAIQAQQPHATPDVAKSRVRVVNRVWNDELGEYEEQDVESKAEPEVQVEKQQAFSYIEIWNEAGTAVETCEIKVEDQRLNETVESIVHKVYPERWFKTWPKPTYMTRSPFIELVRCYDALLDLASHEVVTDTPEDKRLKQDVKLLLEYVRTSPDLVSYFKTRNEDARRISFKYLWTLFPPGTEIVAKAFMGQWQLFRLDDDVQHTYTEVNKEHFRLNAWCWEWSGRVWLRAVHNFDIVEYKQTREISSLAVHPLAYHKDGTYDSPVEFRAAAVKVGQKFIDLCHRKGADKIVLYNDEFILRGKARSAGLYSYDPGASASRHKITDEIVVDAGVWYETGEDFYLQESAPSEYYESNEDHHDEELPNEPVGDWRALCPPRFFGYSLKTKVLAQFKVSAAKPAKSANKKPFTEELQLRNEDKEMLMALVEQQFDRSQMANADIVDSKGRNLVILLYGPPGVGKTLTAETLALAAGKPLLVVTVADIGLDFARAEERLMEIFERATSIDAIVLVDEADVFLETRDSTTSIDRNALVSVLLRALEYFAATIILTTNRITSFDPAIQSRIHMAIRYDDLREDQRKAVFMNCLKRSKVSSEELEVGREWFEEQAPNTFDGREIRNLVSTAMSCAKQENSKLKRIHLLKVYKMAEDFKRQLAPKTAEWKVQSMGVPGRRY